MKRFFSFLAIFLLFGLSGVVQQSHAAIGVETPIELLIGGGDPSISASLNCGTGSDRVLLVGLYDRSGGTEITTPLRYAGVDLTQIGSSYYEYHTDHFLSLWLLVAPATSTNNLTITFSASQASGYIAAVCLTGVDQTTPVDTLGTATNSDTTITQNISSATGDMVFDFVSVVHSGGGGSVAVGAGQTSVVEEDGWAGGFWSNGMSREDGGATVTMSWTTAAVTKWGSVAVNVNAVGAGAPAAVPRVINY